MWLWVYCNKIPIYPIFYLLKGDYIAAGSGTFDGCCFVRFVHAAAAAAGHDGVLHAVPGPA